MGNNNLYKIENTLRSMAKRGCLSNSVDKKV